MTITQHTILIYLRIFVTLMSVFNLIKSIILSSIQDNFYFMGWAAIWLLVGYSLMRYQSPILREDLRKIQE